MKYLITTIAAVVLVGCGESDHQHSHDHSHADGDHDHAESDGQDHDKELRAAETVVEAKKPEPARVKAPEISIWTAAFVGNIEAVTQHLAAGTDVNVKDKLGDSLLHEAMLYKSIQHTEIIKLLIANGADVNAKNKNERTPLHDATSKERAEQLVTNGADVNAKDMFGKTPLHYAARSGHKEIVELLIAKGADMNVKDVSSFRTPLDLAISSKRSETADLIRKHGGKTGEELPLATLHEAAMRGDLQKIKYLLAKGADVNEKHKFGDTPLDYAIHGGRRTADLLLKHGAKRGISLKAEGK